MNSKEYLVDLEEKFEKVKKLIEASVHDPEAEPYYSKYAARQHLDCMNNLLEDITKSEDGEKTPKLIGMLGAVKLQLGIIAMDTEELSVCEKQLEECFKITENHTLEPEVASVALNLYNYLGLLWAKREADKGLEYLVKAEEFYNQIKESKIVPVDYQDLFCTDYNVEEPVAINKFDKAFVLTLYYLAQVYSPKNALKSAVYCHRTLQRQLDLEDYEHIDWALNTATLSQFFMEKNGFKQARHHLCASSYMLEQYKKVLNANYDASEEHEAKVEVFRHRSADVARCWIKYCINLLTASKERLLNSSNVDAMLSIITDLAKMNIELDFEDMDKEWLLQLDFVGIDLSPLEIEVSDQFVLTMDDAKHVMKFGQRHVTAAQDYYTLNTLASDYIEISLDHSRLYDTLSFFEEDPDVRSKLFKRAIDILESVLEQVNHKYYQRQCQQIWHRLGMLYIDMLDIKLDRLENSTSRPVQQAIAKINTLVGKAIGNYQKFIDSYRNASGDLPSRVSADDEVFFLRAYFHIAACQTRFITLDKRVQLENTRKSLEAYKAFIDYCGRNEKAQEAVSAEMSVAKEMVILLPLKIARITNELPPPIVTNQT